MKVMTSIDSNHYIHEILVRIYQEGEDFKMMEQMMLKWIAHRMPIRPYQVQKNANQSRGKRMENERNKTHRKHHVRINSVR